MQYSWTRGLQCLGKPSWHRTLQYIFWAIQAAAKTSDLSFALYIDFSYNIRSRARPQHSLTFEVLNCLYLFYLKDWLKLCNTDQGQQVLSFGKELSTINISVKKNKNRTLLQVTSTVISHKNQEPSPLFYGKALFFDLVFRSINIVLHTYMQKHIERDIHYI